MRPWQRWATLAVVLVLAGCSSTGRKTGTATPGGRAPVAALPADCPEGSPYTPASEDPSTRGNYTAGGLYRPGVRDTTPAYVPRVECIPEPEVRAEPRSAVGNRSPYTVLGKQYQVLDDRQATRYSETGIASYYGAKFHGRLTSNREVYDMYTFSAAHKSLPLPSFAEVTNLDNGESVIVRVNDRGPFHEGRVIDLSYAAAVKLGITQRGTGRVSVRALSPDDERARNRSLGRNATRRAAAPPAPARATTAPAASSAAVAVQPLAPAATAAAPSPAAALLQVGSFASRDNADRALRQLLSAGIAGGQLQDVVSNGQTLWRVRVAAGDLASVPQLARRIAELGLGQPRVVTD